MKKLLTILLVVCFCVPAYATGLQLKASDPFIETHKVPDSAGTAYTSADSVEVTVTFQDGTESMSATWFNNADAQAALVNGNLYFFDDWDDMNGTDGVGMYTVLMRWYDGSGAALDFQKTIIVQQTTLGLEDISDSLQAILAYFDTLIYVGPRGPGVYLDSAAGNTNTVIGTDGTGKNPVSTIAAAKTLATALGYNRYYFLNASTFNSAANDIPSSHQYWEFIGIGNSNALAFGTQRVDESRFENMDLSGTMHASGGNVLYTNCTLGYITANFNGHAFNCLLADTIVVKADVDIEFVRCQSDVGGNRTPTIDLSGGSSVVQVRGYYGGIRIMNGSSNDTISIETDGQVIISANNTSLTVTIRGMLSPTDSGTTTNLTKDAVFSRAEAALWVWANADTTHPDSSEIGVWLVNNLSGAASGLDTLSTVFVDRLAGRMADTTWLSLFTARDGIAGSFGDSAQGWGATAASALDSIIISNILHRIVWGTPIGSGSDSSTSAQRDVGVLNPGAISSGSFANDAIISTKIAAGTFTASKFGTGFIQNTSFADRAISLSKFDSTVIAILTEAIWLDDAAANTNTTVGIDGTITNPVSTLAAARILADSQSLQQYYLINNSSFTLDATYEDWVFLGIGRGNSINFGSQDTDGSDFYNLMITGTQGGTGVVLLDKCYLNTPDSLEALVTRSSLSDTISVRVSTATVFDQCYSNIAGNTTPGLDFNSAGTIEVGVRHYSGGLTLFNGISTHTISFEETGQLIIDASCTSMNVIARGDVKITDNGTTTALDDTAVFNTTQNIGINWADIDNKTSIVDLTQTLIDTDQKVDLNSDQFYEIWSPSVSPLIIEKAAAITDGSNTTITFKTSLPVATDDWYNGQQMVFRYATSPDSIKVINIVDHTGSDSFVVIRDGLPTAPASGDSIWVLASRTAVEPLTLANIKLALTATGHAGLNYDNVNSQIDGEDFTSAYYDSIAVRADSGLAAINRIDRVVGPHYGSVNDAAPTASQFVVSAGIGAYGDDFFNTLFLTFITGNLLGRHQRITDFETTNDTIFVTSFFAAPANGDSFSIGPGNFDIISDSSVYQGAAGALTAEGVKDAVWGQTADTSFVAGSMGDSAKAWGRVGGTGAGNQPETVYVYDTGNSVTVPNIPIQARNSSGTNLGQVTTNSEGYGVLNQDDAATIYVRISGSSGYVAANNPETISVASPYRDTVYVVAFSPSAPAGDLCGVYGWVKDESDNPVEGAEITATIDSYYWPIKYQNQAIVAHANTTSDSLGYWYLAIFPSGLLLTAYGDSSSSYGMSCSYQGQSIFRHQKVTVPDLDTWEMEKDAD